MKLLCPYCHTEFNEEKAHGQIQQCPQCKRPVSLELLETAVIQETSGDRAIRRSVEESLLTPGTVLDGYEILELVGKGGMGAVYKARQTRLEREVAIKVIAPALLANAEFVNRFHQEAKILAELNHPNIVSIIDKGEFTIGCPESKTEGPKAESPHPEAGLPPAQVSKTPSPVMANAAKPSPSPAQEPSSTSTLYYFVMEYIEGKSLRTLMREGKITPAEALHIIPQICDALEYAHGRGVIHRDIKPENVLITPDGRVKVTDFGIVKVVHGEKPLQELTMSGVVLGTYDYMAPEQRFNPKLVDQRADIYSLGVVLYEMLTGELPVGKFTLPSKKVSLSVELDEVVLKALERDPQHRYQKVREVREDITHLQEFQKKPQEKPPEKEEEKDIFSPLRLEKWNSAASVASGLKMFFLGSLFSGLKVFFLGFLFFATLVVMFGVSDIISEPSQIPLCIGLVAGISLLILLSASYIRPLTFSHRLTLFIMLIGFFSISYGERVAKSGHFIDLYLLFFLTPILISYLLAYFVGYPGRSRSSSAPWVSVCFVAGGLMWVIFFRFALSDYRKLQQDDVALVPYQYFRLVEGKDPFATQALLRREKISGADIEYLIPWIEASVSGQVPDVAKTFMSTGMKKEIAARTPAEQTAWQNQWLDLTRTLLRGAEQKEKGKKAIQYPNDLKVLLMLELGLLTKDKNIQNESFVQGTRDTLLETTRYALDHFTPESTGLVRWSLLSLYVGGPSDLHFPHVDTPLGTSLRLEPSNLADTNLLDKIGGRITGTMGVPPVTVEVDPLLRQTLLEVIDQLIETHALPSSCSNEGEINFLDGINGLLPFKIMKEFFRALSPCVSSDVLAGDIFQRFAYVNPTLPVQGQELATIALQSLLDTSAQFLNGSIAEPPAFFNTSLMDNELYGKVHNPLNHWVSGILQNPRVVPYLEPVLVQPVPREFRLQDNNNSQSHGGSSFEWNFSETRKEEIPFIRYIAGNGTWDPVNQSSDQSLQFLHLLLAMYKGSLLCDQRYAIFQLVTHLIDLPKVVQNAQSKPPIPDWDAWNKRKKEREEPTPNPLTPAERDKIIQEENNWPKVEKKQREWKRDAGVVKSIGSWLRAVLLDKEALGREGKLDFDNLPFYTPPKNCRATFFADVLKTYLYPTVQKTETDLGWSSGEEPSWWGTSSPAQKKAVSSPWLQLQDVPEIQKRLQDPGVPVESKTLFLHFLKSKPK